MTDRRLDAALHALRWPCRLTLAGLWIERLARAFWPLSTLLLLLFAALSFGVQDLLSPRARMVAMALIGLVAAGTLVLGAIRFRPPSRRDALLRIDRSLAGRPIGGLADHLAAGAGDAGTREVWQAHLDRLLAHARAARAVMPDLRLSARDPLALRHAALVAAAMALVFGNPWRAGEIIPLGAPPAQAMPAGPLWEAWARPPAHTGKPTLYLNDVAAGPLALPEDSLIQIRLYDAAALAVDQTIADGAPQEDTSTPDAASAMPDLVAFSLRRSGRLAIHGPGGRAWDITAIPDVPPVVTPVGAIGRDADGNFHQEFTATDDYGVRSGTATITLDLDKVTRDYGLAPDPDPIAPVVLDLPMPFRGNPADIRETLIDDLSQSVLANLPVHMVLAVRDAPGHEGRAEPIRAVLPGRRFFDPMAAAVIEMRRDLLWSHENTARATAILRAMIHRPDDLVRSPRAVRRLRRLVRGADLGGTKALDEEARDRVAEELWDIALMFEEGDLRSAREELQRAQDRLEEAIRNGASKEEIDRLMSEMQDAMRAYAQELARDAERNPDGAGDGGQEITGDQLQQMLDEIRRLMDEGRTAEAMALMEELRQLLENLEVREGEGGAGDSALGDLGRTLREQQDLADDAYRGLQDGREGEEAADPDALGDRQRELRRELGATQEGALPGDGTEPGEAGRDALDDAGRAMEEAEEALRRRDLGGALDRQADAMEALRRGLREFDRAARERGDGDTRPDAGRRLAERGDSDTTDPLGRETGRSARIGSDRDTIEMTPDERARALLDEIRRRSAEVGRPAAELDYLKRLLDLF